MRPRSLRTFPTPELREPETHPCPLRKEAECIALLELQDRAVHSTAPKGGGCGGNDLLRLAGLKREGLGLVYVRGPVMRLCGHVFCIARALPPYPLQGLGKQLTAETLRLFLRNELPEGEVRLLPAGARSTESYTPDLHHCSMGAGTLRPASHLAL